MTLEMKWGGNHVQLLKVQIVKDVKCCYPMTLV